MPEKKAEILLFQRLVPAYRSGVFKAMHERLGIMLCYSSNRKQNDFGPGSQVDFPSERLAKIQLTASETAVLQFPLRVLFKYKPNVVISEGSPSYATLWLLLFWRFFFRYKLVLWTHGVKNNEFDKAFQGRSGKLRRFLLNRADALVVYSEQRKNKLLPYLKNPAKILVAPNTLDTETESKFLQKLQTQGRASLKNELQWECDFNLIFLGRLTGAKNLEKALKSMTEGSIKHQFKVHIIGDGPERKSLEARFANHPEIQFYGAEFDRERLAKYLYASDLMLIPGQVGLSIVHAFCYGCPVLACLEQGSEPIPHGPEFSYLQPGYNGFLVKDCENELATKMNEIIRNKDLNLLAENALNTIRDQASLSKMLDGFQQMLNFLGQQKL